VVLNFTSSTLEYALPKDFAGKQATDYIGNSQKLKLNIAGNKLALGAFEGLSIAYETQS
jgi:hypothetical protein